MKTTNRYLTFALITQLIFVFIYGLSTQSSNDISAKKFIDINFDLVDELSIQAEDTLIEIRKVNDIWVLPEHDQLNVADTKIDALFADLKELSVQWPVATTKNATERFEVASDNAQKIIRFKQGDKVLKTVYLGTSPGRGKVHARIDGEDIFAIDLAPHQISADVNEWFNKQLLSITQDIDYVKTSEFELKLEGDAWSLANMDNDMPPDSQAINTWVKRFNQLEVNQLIAPEQAQKITIQDPVFTVNLRSQDKAYDFAFYKSEDKTFIKLFGEPRLFSMLDYQSNDIIEVSTDKFQKKKAQEATSDQTTNDTHK